MRLTDCFIELIVYITYFAGKKDKSQFSFDQIKSNVMRLLSESQARLDRGNIAREDYDLARFAVIAWIDETLLNSNWGDKDQWQREQLQRIYYQTTEAGEIFFERMNTIGLHQGGVREVYYLCLALGFQGRYCHEGDDYLLDQLKTSNLKLLTGSSIGIPTLDKNDLFPEAYAMSTEALSRPKMQRRFSIFTLSFIGFPVVLFLGLYLIYAFILNNVADTILK